ncbi:MAG: iron-sulfur cluster insertion protein ErpA [Alphaproteobacteria bacterium]|nr:iron-sulfur cluster insertion protein ErpA [Alphaproteobacteria bacterium]
MHITITDAAAQQIKHLQVQENDPSLFLRITVEGGGCSGFQYEIKIDTHTHENDHIFTHEGAQVVVDDVSLELISGSEINYVEDLSAAQFIVGNPQASSKCGCGNSFSL